MKTVADGVYSSLKQGFQGDLIRPGDDSYESARRIWNGMVAGAPGLIARSAGVSDVQLAVRAAAEHEALTAVRCGGHSLAGFSTCDGGLVIDLSRMRQVTVDAASRRARFAGGCLLGDIDVATQQHGLVFPAGVVSHTGASGLILGGGFGWLTRRFGLSCDNVEAFTLVTAGGGLVRANAKENPDLFWALRGGGGNFGVVTEFEVRLHPLRSVLLVEAMSLGDDVSRVLRHWRDFMPDAREDLKWNLSLRLAMDVESVPKELRGKPVLSQSLLWTGDADEGSRYIEQALSIGKPQGVGRKLMSFIELQTMADDEFPHGRRYYTKSGYFRVLDDASIERMVEALRTIPSPLTQIELAYLGAAASRVGASETAFGDRSSPFVVNLLGNWADTSEDAPNISWVREVFQSMRPSMTPGVYVNFMSGDEDDRVPEAYRERWERLVAIKSQYDPNNLFRLNQNIRPQGRSAAPN
ncbi:MAG TPA: FAD-binding oxidoreductase [Terriglobales bacterium]|nr:FAD-binding oxidoreductase [Terriglobales bacterium]